PVLVNTFGAADRLAMALGVGHLDELGERVGKLLDVKLPGTFAERLRKLGTLFDLVKAGPRRVTEGPCQEVVETEHPSLARMLVALALGGDPAMIYAASAPLPPGVDEVVFAGWLRGSGVEMVACRTIDLEAPAHAEIVLEGYVDPRERRLEGPFGDHTGYYSL